MITLALDAATYVGTVAVLRDGDVLATREIAMRGRDVERLMPAVADALDAATVRPADIGRVVCGEGSGSFTSLRIAASIAKGLATGIGCSMYAVSSLALIVAGAPDLPAGMYVAVLDAMRGDAYAAPFERTADGVVRAAGDQRLISESAVPLLARELAARVVGPEREIDKSPHVRGLSALEGMLSLAGPVPLGSWEPRYGRLAEAQVKWEAAQGRALPIP